MSSNKLVFPLVWVLCLSRVSSQRLALVTEREVQTSLLAAFESALTSALPSASVVSLVLTRNESELTLNSLCSSASEQGFDLLVDLTWGGWIRGRRIASSSNWPYVRVDVANHQVVRALENFVTARNQSDLAVVLKNSEEMEQTLIFMITNSYLRLITAHMEERRPLERLTAIRPRASNYVLVGDAESVRKSFNHAQTLGLLTRDRTWTLILDDFDEGEKSWIQSTAQGHAFYVLELDNCCHILNTQGGSCSCGSSFSLSEETVKASAAILAETLQSMRLSPFDCNSSLASDAAEDFKIQLGDTADDMSSFIVTRDRYDVPLINPPLDVRASLRRMDGLRVDVGQWSLDKGWEMNQGAIEGNKRRFLRVGVLLKKPWAWVNKTGVVGTRLSDLDMSDADLGLVGYSLDVLHEMVKEMDFDYELVPHVEAGNRDPESNQWSGLMSDLISMDIDLSVAPLTMTTEREEVVDFISPFFAQSGLSILLRKKLPKLSIFKFLQVLDIEVWLGILVAVLAVALMLWSVDRLSPYSFCNSPQRYPEGTRDFSLGESLWFSLTSLTPQGGGECPKSLSARVLVASYWLFIVLMLATFTANLAAFLTVERMQTTVQSLDELAAQSRINYSVMADSVAMEYFVNMKHAEEELFKQWKAVALASASDDPRFRVWDYPVREQYTHMLKVIEKVGVLENLTKALDMVESSIEGEFAFIHEKTELEFYFYENCNFHLVGDAFAEQPLALAVQQGSMLLKEVSEVVLRLQKESFFDALVGRFWNSAKRASCPVLDDSEGITLYSLGGIFIATVAGLSLSMVTLGYEVYRQKGVDNNRANMVPGVKSKESNRGNKGHLVNNRIMTIGSKQVPIPGAIVN